MSTDDLVRDHAIVGAIRDAVPTVVAVYLFGSVASGTQGPDSDVDIAILPAQPLDPVTRFDAQARVAAMLRRSVDLVDLRVASPVMAMQVLANGKLIDEGDPVARGAFEDRVFGAYARLNEERRGILDRVSAEGSVYGR
jgi:predicted nucleotidyltransferase